MKHYIITASKLDRGQTAHTRYLNGYGKNTSGKWSMSDGHCPERTSKFETREAAEHIMARCEKEAVASHLWADRVWEVVEIG